MSPSDASHPPRRRTLGGRVLAGLIPADVLRLLGLLIVPAAGAVAGWPSAAAMFLVFGGQWLLRWLAGGSLLDWTGQVLLLAAGWASAGPDSAGDSASSAPAAGAIWLINPAFEFYGAAQRVLEIALAVWTVGVALAVRRPMKAEA